MTGYPEIINVSDETRYLTEKRPKWVIRKVKKWYGARWFWKLVNGENPPSLQSRGLRGSLLRCSSIEVAYRERRKFHEQRNITSACGGDSDRGWAKITPNELRLIVIFKSDDDFNGSKIHRWPSGYKNTFSPCKKRFFMLELPSRFHSSPAWVETRVILEVSTENGLHNE